MEKNEKTKDLILTAAIKEFANNGYQGARMNSIAKISGVNKALIHYYFKSKEDLYKSVLESIFADKHNNNFTFNKSKYNLTPPQKFYSFIYFMSKTHPNISNNDGYRIYFWELAEGNKFIAPLIKRYTIPRLEMILKIIQDGIDQNYFQIKNPHFFIFHISSLFETYHVHKINIDGSEWYDKIYGGGTDALFNYVVEYSFKMLNPGNKEVVLPEMESDIIKLLDELINEFNKGNFSEMDGDNFCKFMSMLID